MDFTLEQINYSKFHMQQADFQATKARELRTVNCQDPE